MTLKTAYLERILWSHGSKNPVILIRIFTDTFFFFFHFSLHFTSQTCLAGLFQSLMIDHFYGKFRNINRNLASLDLHWRWRVRCEVVWKFCQGSLHTLLWSSIRDQILHVAGMVGVAVGEIRAISSPVVCSGRRQAADGCLPSGCAIHGMAIALTPLHRVGF